ncbi:MAG: YicC family protein [Acidobacteria bacterium]|nr:MAG: YicC family protein [Acidobacteriota bacterium]
MSIRSMTGFAQVKGQQDKTAFTFTAKSVNHRFLDLHLRLPAKSELLEQQLRKLFKEKLHRGHVEVTLTLEYAGASGLSVNRELVSDYVKAFRELSSDLDLHGEIDLNAIFRLTGVLSASNELPEEAELQAALLSAASELIGLLNANRQLEGNHTRSELEGRMDQIERNTAEVETLRAMVLQAHLERIRTRMAELLEGQADPDRILQEAAMLAERSDVQEEIVRLLTHVKHFRGLLEEGGEIGKKLDFLLQEMNREANTMLSKTTGLAGDAMRITELGLALKSDIEKSREQVQNVE